MSVMSMMNTFYTKTTNLKKRKEVDEPWLIPAVPVGRRPVTSSSVVVYETSLKVVVAEVAFDTSSSLLVRGWNGCVCV
jgi:hypothetical protein